jgi:hypothetical protein
MSINREEIHNELTAIKTLLTQGLSGVELERNLLVYKALVLSLNLSLNSIPAESDVVPGEQIQSDWTQTDNTLKDFIKNKPTTFTPTAHTHDDRYYTETEIDLALLSKSNTGHTHTSSNITDFQTTVSLNSDVAANTAARHTHSNKTILDAITEAFTTALKTAYDSTVTWISTNGSSLISHLTNTSNPHSVTKTQVGLANVANVDTTTTANITDSLNKRFITDAKKTVLDNTSNTNTGDETTASIQTKRPLKTVNGESLEGAGNVAISGSGIADAPNDANAYVRSGLAWVIGYTKTALDTLLSGKAATSHTHTKSDITDFTHSHIISDVTGLQTALDGKAASSHTHTKSQITDFAHTHPQSEITNLVTDLGNKQATLVSGTNIKTINGESLLGSGNISIAGGSEPTVLRLAANTPTAANTTPVNLVGLVFNYLANSIYVFDMSMFVTPTAATTGCGFQLDVSTAVTKIGITFYHQLATSGTLSGGSSVADDVSYGVSSGMAGTTIQFVNGKGILITGANPGTAQFRFRSETNAVTTCNADSTITINKIQ